MLVQINIDSNCLLKIVNHRSIIRNLNTSDHYLCLTLLSKNTARIIPN